MGQVDNEVGVQIGALEVLAVVENVTTAEELLIEENNYAVVGGAHNCSSQSEGDILSLGRVNVDHTVSHAVVIYMLGGVGLTPEGEVFLVKEGGAQKLKVTAF